MIHYDLDIRLIQILSFFRIKFNKFDLNDGKLHPGNPYMDVQT